MLETEKCLTKITFVRHGETFHNASGTLQGHNDSELNPKGIEHAEVVSAEIYRRLYQEQMGGLLDALSNVVVVSSDLSRCVDTAGIIAEQLGIDKEKIEEYRILRERDYGEYAGTPTKNFFDRVAEIRGEDKQKIPPVTIWDSVVTPESAGVETYASMALRTAEFFTTVKKKHAGERMVAVTHGAQMHALLLLLGAETEESLDARQINNMAQFDVVVRKDGTVELVRDEDNNLSIQGVEMVGVYDLRKN